MIKGVLQDPRYAFVLTSQRKLQKVTVFRLMKILQLSDSLRGYIGLKTIFLQARKLKF